MNKFKTGDKVRYANSNFAERYGQEGIIVNIAKAVLCNEVMFKKERDGGYEYCADEELELAEPTTLERLAELEKSGEEFMINGSNLKYSFIENFLMINGNDDNKSDLRLNQIISFGIQEMPWTPKEGETFFYVTSRGKIETITFQSHTKNQVDSGNFFRTKELAEAAGIAKIFKEANHG